MSDGEVLILGAIAGLHHLFLGLPIGRIPATLRWR